MKTGNTIIADKASATGYDSQAQKTNWFGPDVVFGLMYEYIQHGETLLDLGIGSGLSAMPFHKAGLQVSGLDGSQDVLDVCAVKNFAVELKCHDLRQLPLPYKNGAYKHVISVAVLNGFKELELIFKEIARIVLPGGIFAFTFESRKEGDDESYPINRVEVEQAPTEEAAVRLFRHGEEYIRRILNQSGFSLVKSQEFTAFKYPAEHRDVYFTANITRK